MKNLKESGLSIIGNTSLILEEQQSLPGKSSLLELSEANFSEITENEIDDVELDDIEKLYAQKKPKIYKNDKNYSFSFQDRQDVFIKNYLLKFDMHRTLKVFEQEFFEQLSKEEIEIDSIPVVPAVYIESEKLQESIGNIQKELDDAKIVAEKAKSLFLKLHRGKESQKIKHRRVQQEKQRYIQNIEKLKKFSIDDEKAYKELQKKYREVTEDSLLLENEQKRLKSRYDALNNQYEQLKKTLEESKKQQLKEKEEKTMKEEEFEKKNKGNLKIINWTPFPNVPKISFDSGQPASTNMQLYKIYPGHLSSVTSIEMHPKKAVICTTSDDKTWKLWKFPTGELLMHGEGHKDWISGASFHPEGLILATCSGDASIKFWDILSQKCLETIKDYSQPIWKIKYHHTGSFLLAASMDHSIRLYDMNNYRARVSYHAHVDSVNSINWIYMTNTFISGSADKTISMWDMRTNMCTQTFYGHNNAVNSCAVNLQGDLIASCDADGIVKLWDIRVIKELKTFDKCKQSANCISFDRSGDIVACGYDDTYIRLFSTKSVEINTSYKHEDAVLDLMFDIKNKTLLSASADKSFRIWQ